MSKTRTNALTQAILDYLALSRVYAWRNNNAGVYDPIKKVFRSGSAKKGIADIIGVLPDGRHLEIEVKTGKDRQSVEQIEHEARIKEQGGIYILARSVDDVIVSKNKILELNEGEN